MDFLNKPIAWIINLCYKLIPNYAVALLIFAIIMKLLLFPFGIKQQKNMLKQAKLRPKEMAIRKRYAGRDDQVTRQKMQDDLMKLYQKEGYSPASGCLPMILQLVIVFAVYAVMRAPLTYVSGLSKSEINNLGVGIVELYNQGKLDKNTVSKSEWDKIVSIHGGLNNLSGTGSTTAGGTGDTTTDGTTDTTTDGTTDTTTDGTTDTTTDGTTETAPSTTTETTTDGNGTGIVETTDKPLKDISNATNPFAEEISLVRVVRKNFELLQENGRIPDKIASANNLPRFYLYGNTFDLSETPTPALNWYLLIPILTFVFTFGSMKLSKKFMYQSEVQQQQSADMGCSMKIMDYVMPLMSTFITFSMPSIIAVYWIYNNVLSFVQQVVLKFMFPIPVFTEEDYKQAEIEMNKGIKQPKKKKANSAKRAAHRIDLDDEYEAPESEPKAEKAIEKKAEPKPKKKKDPKEGLIAPGQLKDESDKKSDNE